MRDSGTITDAVGLVSSDQRENIENPSQGQRTASGELWKLASRFSERFWCFTATTFRKETTTK